MPTGTYRLLRTINGHTNFARVTVRVGPPVESSPALAGCLDSQWKLAATSAARFALVIAEFEAEVAILNLEGTIVDTTPAAVAAATCHAVWQAIEFQPTSSVAERLLASLVAGRGSSELPEYLATL